MSMKTRTNEYGHEWTFSRSPINNPEEAKLFFAEYDIPYKEIKEGEDKGKLLVKPVPMSDGVQVLEVEKRLQRSRLHIVTDHSNVFLDRNNDVIVTFSPYNIYELPPRRPWLEMSDYSIYGNGTKTFVVRVKREEILAAELKELEPRIQLAEETMLRKKREYDAAVEEMAGLLKERDRLSKGIDGGRVSMYQWSCSWNGNAVWDAGTVTMDCNYQAKITFKKDREEIHGSEIQKLEMEHPGFQKKDIIEALTKSICAKLDDEFEEYCSDDDYYPPVVEDFEAKAYARDWAEERGLKLIRFEGNGEGGDYEPKSRRRR